MSRNQRLGFLGIAVLIAVVAVVAFTAGSGGDDEREAQPAAGTATPTATATGTDGTETATPTPTPKPKPPLLTSAGVKELEFEEGQIVRFRVASSKDEEIHVHGYNITKAVPAGRTITVAFPATITGIFEIELHGSGTPIAELKVEPE
jgi:hypothetical protein